MTAAVSVRPMQAADLERVDDVLRAAFDRPASFLDHARLTCRLQPDGVFVAERAGAIVGTVGAVDYGEVVYVGLMAVTPAEQGRGIGRLLMEHLLTWVDRRGGVAVLLDATDRGALLYETLGFADDSAAYLYVGPSAMALHGNALPCGQQTPTGGASMRLAAPADLDELAAFDAPRFGADRRKLLAALLVEQGEPCLVARDALGRVAGYLFVRGAVLGPWVADDAEVAEVLLIRARSMRDTASGEGAQVMLPRSNEAARSLLLVHGFREQRKLRHMRRGGACGPGRPACLFGQSSFAHG